MVMYVVSGFFFVWLLFLSWIVYKTRKHYFNLIGKTKKEKIDEILDELLRNNDRIKTQIDLIKKELTTLIDSSKISIQKVGLVRFNPFERAGVEQSFVLSLLNKYDSGVVINFIYTREGVRVYIKKVKYGRGDKYELSDEERKAIKESN